MCQVFMSLACITQFLVIIGQNNLPNIVPVAIGIVVGNAGVVYTTVTGAGVVTPIDRFRFKFFLGFY
jgi:hypothetical protein